MTNNPPPVVRGQFIRFKKCEQIPASFPAIAIYCSYPQEIKESYRNFLENNIRKKRQRKRNATVRKIRSL